ncbi:MAG: phosphatidate cytidylyltransferase [Pirellula sp.]
MLHRRLISAACLVGVAVLLIVLDLRSPVAGQAGIWLIPLFLAFTLGTVWEACQLLARKIAIQPRYVLVHASFGCAVSLFPIWYSWTLQATYPIDCPVGRTGWVLIGILSGVGSAGIQAILQLRQSSLSAAMASAPTTAVAGKFPEQQNPEPHGPDMYDKFVRSEFERTTLAWVVSSFVLAYVVGCMSFWLLVRLHGSSLQGILNLVSLLAIVKFADAGAYFVGKSIGKRKLIPLISPGKTVEGLFGGLVASIAVSYLFLRVLLPWCGGQVGTWWFGPALLGCLLTLIGLVGDLLESMVKRMVGAKDSGTMLPGLGGVWDVTDSLLPTAIVGYLGIIAKLT